MYTTFSPIYLCFTFHQYICVQFSPIYLCISYILAIPLLIYLYIIFLKDINNTNGLLNQQTGGNSVSYQQFTQQYTQESNPIQQLTQQQNNAQQFTQQNNATTQQAHNYQQQHQPNNKQQFSHDQITAQFSQLQKKSPIQQQQHTHHPKNLQQFTQQYNTSTQQNHNYQQQHLPNNI